MRIHNLLNPLCTTPSHRPLPTTNSNNSNNSNPSSTPSTPTPPPQPYPHQHHTTPFHPHPNYPTSLLKRQKLAKDAPIFTENTKTIGYVNYPPHTTNNDANLEAQHRKFSVRPYPVS